VECRAVQLIEWGIRREYGFRETTSGLAKLNKMTGNVGKLGTKKFCNEEEELAVNRV
jgi:hypothetical protein